MNTLSHCIFFRPSALASWVCARWCVPIKGKPFCLADIELCETQGLRLMPRADQEEDSFE